MVGFVTPYTSTLNNYRVEKLDYESSKTYLKETRSIQNPFKSVHLAALINFGEFTTLTSIVSSLERDGKRGIPIEVKGKFFKKARGLLTGTSENIKIPENAKEYVGITNIRNEDKDLVATVYVTVVISDKKKIK